MKHIGGLAKRKGKEKWYNHVLISKNKYALINDLSAKSPWNALGTTINWVLYGHCL